MVKYNDTDGVWRTVGGRRIFIKNGQDLASAMKESGKFKKSKTEVKDEQKKFGEQKEWEKNNKQYFRGDEGKPVSERTGEPYKETSHNNIRERDVKDLLKELNDEGSDFTFGDAIIKDGKIETDVGVFMPDERGYVTKDLSIPIDKNETYASLENKLRDWQSRHNSPDSFYDKDFKSDKKGNEISSKTYKSLDEAKDKYKSSSINDNIRRKAYQKYLKEHPNSKMKFEEFKDMRKQ